MKKTPLYERQTALGGRIVDFSGWALPVQYTGIAAEHKSVRSAAGMFDVSHMGEIRITGTDAKAYLQNMMTNDIELAHDGRAVYSPMCYENGGVVDDLLIYKYSDEEFLLVVNAANTDKDFEWLKQYISGDVTIENVSDDYAQLAVQGPKAEAILQKLIERPLSDVRFFHFEPDVVIQGISLMLSRSGYTGEDGFELYLSNEDAPKLWDMLLEAGRDDGLVPVGLGARDTLRLEAALPLYGQDLSADITPLEARLSHFVKFDKGDFIGRDALLRQKENGLARKLVGFVLDARGIPRHGCDVRSSGRSIGHVTSGSMSPSLGKGIGMTLIETAFTAEGAVIDIMIRGKAAAAHVVRLPFYTKKYKQTAKSAK